MRIRTQFLLLAALFGVVLLAIGASVASTTAGLDRLDRQAEIAGRVELAANDLNYLAGDYLVYGDSLQRARWEARDTELAADLAAIPTGSSDQQALIAAVAADRARLESVFRGVAAQRDSAAAPADLAALQASWSRVGVQTQALAFDAGRLAALIAAEADAVRFVNTLLVSALLGSFAVLLLANYLLVGRRAMRSVAALQAGADAIGSGTLDQSIPAESDDEVGDLARSFNRMAADLATVTASRAELEREVAERKRAEAAFRESSEMYRELFMHDITGDFVAAADGRILDCNPAFARMFGFSSVEEALSSSIADTYASPSDREVLLGRIREKGRIEYDERYRRRRDGTPFHVVENIVGIFENGRLVRTQGYIIDDTKRYLAEEELREHAENLRRSNEDLERFAYVSSHDLQEPLRAIVSFSQLLERRYKGQLDADADEYIDFIVDGGNRMQRLILDLLAFSRVNTTQQAIARTDVTDVLAGVGRSLDPQLREAGATLSYDPMPTVMADPLQVEQVFANLVSNAIKFRRPDEPLLIHVGANRFDGFWEFSVSDNGIGIEPEYFEKIFVIFQRLHTKDAYPGTGIGLAIVKRIVDRHGGTIRVESTPGEGSTFYFTLPAA